MLQFQHGALQVNSPVDDARSAVAPCAEPATGRQITSSKEWCRYFAGNALAEREIPWELGAEAPCAELDRIVPSLRGWQLGEPSDGRHLLRAATRYATKVNDPAFLDAARLFIREEQLTLVTLAVWVGHRRALQAGGYAFAHFWRTAWGRMKHAWRMMDPTAYHWPSGVFRVAKCPAAGSPCREAIHFRP